MNILKFPSLVSVSDDEILMILFMSYDGKYPIFYEYVDGNIIEEIMGIKTLHKGVIENVNPVKNYSIIGDKNKVKKIWLNTALHYFSLSSDDNMSNKSVCFSKNSDTITIDIYE